MPTKPSIFSGSIMQIYSPFSSGPLNVTVNVFSFLINAFSSLFYFHPFHIHVFLIMQKRTNYKCRSSFDWFPLSRSLAPSRNERLQTRSPSRGNSIYTWFHLRRSLSRNTLPVLIPPLTPLLCNAHVA